MDQGEDGLLSWVPENREGCPHLALCPTVGGALQVYRCSQGIGLLTPAVAVLGGQERMGGLGCSTWL